MACPRCRQHLPRSASFCRRCGQRVRAVGAHRRIFVLIAWSLFAGLLLIALAAGVNTKIVAKQAAPMDIANIPPPPPGFLPLSTLLTGKWVESPGSKLNAFTRQMTLWCRDDRSFTEESTVFDASNKEDVGSRWSLGGTWRVEGETWVLDATLTTRADVDPTGTWRYAIVSLSGDELILRLDSLPRTAVADGTLGRLVHYRRAE
jgi:hypothetical protein